MRSIVAALAIATALPLVAAAPNASQAPPDGIDYEMTVSKSEPGEIEGQEDTGAINVWTHMSLWDATTCNSSSPDNRCDKTLAYFEDGGEATFTMTNHYAPADYDLVIFESGKSGDAFTEVAHQQNEVRPIPGEGPIPVPGPETVTFEAEADSYYLAVVFYRAAGGGYTLTGEVA